MIAILEDAIPSLLAQFMWDKILNVIFYFFYDVSLSRIQ